MSAKPLYSATQSVTITLASLADGAGVSSSEIDNSTNRFLDADLEVDLTGNDAGESGHVAVYLRRGNDTGDLTTTEAENMTRIGTVKLNGTTAVSSVLRVNDLPKFYSFHAIMKSSGAFALGATGNSMAFLGVNIEDV